MILNNLMEDKQLNFNQPLLSVRRGSSTAPPEADRRTMKNSFPNLALPFYKSDLKSGPIRNPGVVPFQWEQSPGRPKGERSPQKKALEQPPLTPQLPPGRIVNHKRKPSDKSPKDSPVSRIQAEIDTRSYSDISLSDKDVTELKRYGNEVEDKNASSSEDDESTYLDALDTLSRTESFYLNCSVSGVSGLDCPERKAVGSFSDPQIRDFMMGRFLPAAKAVASETPQFSSRKQPAAKQKPAARDQLVEKRVVIRDKQTPVYDHPHHTLYHYTHDEGESEEDDESKDYDGKYRSSAILCGLIPRFCLLNPLPGIKDHGRLPISSVHGLQKSPAYGANFRVTENKGSNVAYEQRLRGVSQRSRIPHRLAHHKSENKPTDHHDSAESKFEFITPHRNAFREEREFCRKTEDTKGSWTHKVATYEKRCKEFPQLSPDKGDEESCHAKPAIEKTLYVDTVQMVESRHANSSSLESRVQSNSTGRSPSIDFSLHDIVKDLSCVDERRTFQPVVNLGTTLDCRNSSRKLNLEEPEILKAVQHGQDNDNLNSVTSERSNLVHNELLTDNDCQPPKPDDRGTTGDSGTSLILQPPLPKSPSESWLCRALPSMILRTPSSNSYIRNQLHSGKQGSRASSIDPKWDSTGKSSNLHHRHIQGLAPISEN